MRPEGRLDNLRLFHGVSTTFEAGARRPLIVRALLAYLSCGRTGRRLSRIVVCLAYRPAMAFVTIRCLLLLTLPFTGIDEQLV